MTLRERDLPIGRSSSLYGEGPRCRAGAESLRAWREQLARWGFRRDQAEHGVRLWTVLANDYSGGTTLAQLSCGRLLRAYSEGMHRTWSHPGRVPPGPNFWLSFRNARALWRDTHVTITPACEQIVLAG